MCVVGHAVELHPDIVRVLHDASITAEPADVGLDAWIAALEPMFAALKGGLGETSGRLTDHARRLNQDPEAVIAWLRREFPSIEQRECAALEWLDALNRETQTSMGSRSSSSDL
jgi:hypothetical protein